MFTGCGKVSIWKEKGKKKSQSERASEMHILTGYLYALRWKTTGQSFYVCEFSTRIWLRWSLKLRLHLNESFAQLPSEGTMNRKSQAKHIEMNEIKSILVYVLVMIFKCKISWGEQFTHKIKWMNSQNNRSNYHSFEKEENKNEREISLFFPYPRSWACVGIVRERQEYELRCGKMNQISFENVWASEMKKPKKNFKNYFHKTSKYINYHKVMSKRRLSK